MSIQCEEGKAFAEGKSKKKNKSYRKQQLWYGKQIVKKGKLRVLQVKVLWTKKGLLMLLYKQWGCLRVENDEWDELSCDWTLSKETAGVDQMLSSFIQDSNNGEYLMYCHKSKVKKCQWRSFTLGVCRTSWCAFYIIILISSLFFSHAK